ncbi:hypothetical protein ACOQFL_16735 [Actinopolyspora sp. H202]
MRTASGLSLNRMYRFFPGKEDLVMAVLRRRDSSGRLDRPRLRGRRAE